jgi:O-antigen ligase
MNNFDNQKNMLSNNNIMRVLQYSAMLYAFILPLSRAGIVAVSIISFIVWLIAIYKKALPRFKIDSVFLALAIFVIYNFISIGWSQHPLEAFRYASKYWYLFSFIIFATSLKKEYINKTLSAFILGMFISEIIAYGVYFELWHFKHATPQNPSPFMHHIEYSIFLALTALILLTKIMYENSFKTKIVYGAFFMTVTGNLFLTAGRTGQLAFVIGLGIVLLSSVKNKLKALLLFLAIGITVFLGAYNLSTTFSKRIELAKNDIEKIVENNNYCSSWGSRAGAWNASSELIKQNPIFGLGLIDGMENFHKHIDTNHPELSCIKSSFMHLHNQYIQILNDLGIIGLILFLFIFYEIYKIKINNKTFNTLKNLYLGILLFAFIPDVIFHRQFNMALFALMISLLLAQHRVENEI